jgi:hypothetical protein
LLKELNLSDNQLTGQIPDLSNLNNLLKLNLSKNQLTGQIPDLSKLFKLLKLNLSKNQLTGQIPDLSNLNNLSELLLFSNNLINEIPSLENLNNLHKLDLSNNQLTGLIPNLDTLKQLRELDLSNNLLQINFTIGNTSDEIIKTYIHYLEKFATIRGTINLKKNLFFWSKYVVKLFKDTIKEEYVQLVNSNISKFGLNYVQNNITKSFLLQSLIFTNYLDDNSVKENHIDFYKERINRILSLNENVLNKKFQNVYINQAHGNINNDSYFILPNNMTIIFATIPEKIFKFLSNKDVTKELIDNCKAFINHKYCYDYNFDNEIYFPGTLCENISLTYFESYVDSIVEIDGMYSINKYVEQTGGYKYEDFTFNKHKKSNINLNEMILEKLFNFRFTDNAGIETCYLTRLINTINAIYGKNGEQITLYLTNCRSGSKQLNEITQLANTIQENELTKSTFMYAGGRIKHNTLATFNILEYITKYNIQFQINYSSVYSYTKELITTTLQNIISKQRQEIAGPKEDQEPGSEDKPEPNTDSTWFTSEQPWYF